MIFGLRSLDSWWPSDDATNGLDALGCGAVVGPGVAVTPPGCRSLLKAACGRLGPGLLSRLRDTTARWRPRDGTAADGDETAGAAV